MAAEVDAVYVAGVQPPAVYLFSNESARYYAQSVSVHHRVLYRLGVIAAPFYIDFEVPGVHLLFKKRPCAASHLAQDKFLARELFQLHSRATQSDAPAGRQAQACR